MYDLVPDEDRFNRDGERNTAGRKDWKSQMRVENTNSLLSRTAVVEQRVTETEDTFSLQLSLQGDGFNFKPGQFNMLGLPGIGEAPFSFSLIDEQKKIFTQTIRHAGNVVSALAKLKKGQKVHFRGPYGNGWPLQKLKGRNVIVVAGGVGMAPLRPVIHYLLKNKIGVGRIYLLYGARTPADMLFKDELARWSKEINVLLSADEVNKKSPLKVHEGLVTTLFDQINITLSDTITFTCGPQIMMKFVAAGLILEGQNPRDIYVSLERRMKCGIGHCGHCQIGAKYVCKDGPVFCLPDIQKHTDALL
jgi:sulfhydrogenase subunit gamma (sulfur reductase)